MDSWWALLPLLLLLLLLPLKNLLFSSTQPKSPPPGPPYIPILTQLYWLSKNPFNIEPYLRSLRTKYGPIITLRMTSRPTIFISDHFLAHQALVHHGAHLSDRLPSTELNRILSSDRHNVSSSPYGALWRALCRNLASEVFNPVKIRNFADARNWVLDLLVEKLNQESKLRNGVVVAMERFQFAMFCLLVTMCFGEKLDFNVIRDIEDVQKRIHKSFFKFSVFAVFPRITKILFRRRWEELLDIRQIQEGIFIPLIRARGVGGGGGGGVSSYVDSLLELSIPENGGRQLTEGEIVSLCSEFLSAGTDTTATVLEWIMAELVKNPEIQERLIEEIESVTKEKVKEENLQNMPYLKAVILEGLRRHPPGHFVLPHVATEDIEIGGYVVPKAATVNFMVGEMGMDDKIWSDPMEFSPERFLVGGEAQEVDITGSREIKMMPFGAGRRICPGLGLAMLHLEYFVANLVREFEWKAVEGEEVDLSETLELAVVMKNHLRARIFPRRKEIKCSI